ncbi:hypothetical protein CFC21_081494 [Triticum aestivum]|uniref:F-box domain-containing protein n=3 Tax=Triticum TaxID=4564 RepID=A0A9R1AV47_TRITD|nr:uncharacterized protein LOC119318837 [Triticum dicoccoides]XP_044405839.1 uncharacterized protein LOC123129945 [Triticum aestivum]KAF7076892.1 hypothetical protein CFC21_081494 [Triticum aestivum]VAI41349.1 unnamed protein product [Triticum turgidum subsp. durum]
MPPGRGRRGRTEQRHPPETGRRDEGAPSRPTPPFPAFASQGMKTRRPRQPPPASLPFAEILSRVPYRSLCRFRCVSKAWRVLCSHRAIQRRVPQTLSGFFHTHHSDGGLRFSNLSGGGAPLVDASLPFLRRRYASVKLEQCSSSLLLCKCRESEEDEECDYVVCNPMTRQWTVLPPIVWQDEEDGEPVYFRVVQPFLGFDPAFPSRFVVFSPLVEVCDDVAIYSSETGRWTRNSEWGDNSEYPSFSAECAFLNGMMHFLHLVIEEPLIAVVDTEGDVCGEITLPEGMEDASSGYSSIGYSQGKLHAWYMHPHYYELSVWVLEDYASEKWTLKHTVDVPELFGRESTEEDCDEEDRTYKYEMFAIHPEHNLIFLTDWKEVNLSYDMDSKEVHLMCTSGDFLGGLPYIPSFADLVVG